MTKQNKQEWREEFLKKFVRTDSEFGQLYTGGTPELVMDFISDLLSAQAAQIIEEVEGMKNQSRHGYGKAINQKLDLVIKKLKGENENKR
jgi:hypothetical protein